MSQWHKQQEEDCHASDANSHVNFNTWLPKKKFNVSQRLHLSHLKSKLDKMIKYNGVQVDEEMLDDFLTTIDKKQKENGNLFYSVFGSSI